MDGVGVSCGAAAEGGVPRVWVLPLLHRLRPGDHAAVLGGRRRALARRDAAAVVRMRALVEAEREELEHFGESDDEFHGGGRGRERCERPRAV